MNENLATKEHKKISQALIEKDNAFLLINYGCLANAEARLLKLEYFLNYKEWK